MRPIADHTGTRKRKKRKKPLSGGVCLLTRRSLISVGPYLKYMDSALAAHKIELLFFMLMHKRNIQRYSSGILLLSLIDDCVASRAQQNQILVLAALLGSGVRI
jgi:hypothetical protein